MRPTDKQKQSLYFAEETLRELAREANRLDRSLSWTMQQAWRLARDEIRKFPSADRHGDADGRSTSRDARARTAGASERSDLDTSRASAQVREFLRGKFDHELTS